MKRLMRQRCGGERVTYVSFLSMIVNVLLMMLKFIVGVAGHSSALLSDAVHSAIDVFSSMVVITGVKIGYKTTERKYPYGHERLECMAAIILAAVLTGTGLGIGLRGIDTIADGDYSTLKTPGVMALWIALLVVLVKEGMFCYTRYIAREFGSSVLMEDAWHHQSDAMASLGGFAGILGARIGFPIMDPAAGIFISMFIIKAAYDVFMDAIAKMIDESCNADTIHEIQEIAESVDGVMEVHVVKTRLLGSKKYVDVEISADKGKTLCQAHEIAHQVHDLVEEQIDGIVHCMIYVNPFDENGD